MPKYEPKLSAQTAKIEERFNVDYTLGANTLVLKTSCSDWRSPIYKNDGSKKFFIVPANRPLTLLPGFQISFTDQLVINYAISFKPKPSYTYLLQIDYVNNKKNQARLQLFEKISGQPDTTFKLTTFLKRPHDMKPSGFITYGQFRCLDYQNYKKIEHGEFNKLPLSTEWVKNIY